MADVKISQLPAASTPLAGTEQIPLVQSSTTKQISVNNLLTSANLGTPTSVNLANATNVPMAEAAGVLAVAHGGTGTTTPSIVAGTNVTVSGTWPNQTISATDTTGVTSVNTGTGLTGGPITTSGTIALADTAVTAGSYTSANITVDAQGRITAAANGSGGSVTSVTGTAPIVSSGGTTPAISMAAANTSTNGYLTSTDWNTFNNKQPAGSYLTSGGALGTPSSGTATNLTGLPLSTGVTGTLPVANGGTGTTTPSLVAGTNVTITGTWPNQTINSSGSSSGTVTNMSVVSANGLAGTVANATTTPAVTLSTTVTGLVKGNGTALSAATAGTDYVAPGGALGTPSSGTLTNTTGLPISTGVSGLGTGIASALAANVGSAGAPVVNGGALGTPSSGTATNLTGLPLSTGVTGTLPIANGGSGQTTAQTAMNAFAGAVTSGSYLRGNGTNVVMSTIQASDVPTLNQNTTGNAGNVTGTVAIANGGTGQTTANAAFNALVPSQATNAGKFLTTDGTNTSWATVATGAVTAVSVATANGFAGTSSGGATPSLTLTTSITGLLKGNGTAMSAATAGTDYIVPGGALGTPSSGTLTNATGLPISTGVSGLGTGVATALAVAVGSAGAPVINGDALGTPSSGTLTNATGLPLSTGVTGILAVANGGTGQTTYTDGQLLIGNSTGNTLTKATLTAGSGISITNGSGSITIAASGSSGVSQAKATAISLIFGL